MMAGFGKGSGPSAPTKESSFGQFPRPPSPSFPNLAPAPPPRGPEVVLRPRSPPLPFENSSAAARPYQYSRVRRPETPQSVPSPPSPYQNPRPAADLPYPSTGVRWSPPYRSIEPYAKLGHGQKPFFKDYDARPHPRPSVVNASQNSGMSVTSNAAQVQDLKRTRSPPLAYTDEILFNPSQTIAPSYPVQQRRQSPPLAFENKNSVDSLRPAGRAPKPIFSSPKQDNNYDLPHQDQSRISPNFCVYGNEKSYEWQAADAQGYKKTWSPPAFPLNAVPGESSLSSLNDSKRLDNKSDVLSGGLDSKISQRSMLSESSVVASSTGSPFPKRSRSPPLLFTDGRLQGSIDSSQYDTEREMQAKAKRLARFKVELSENMPTDSARGDQRVSTNKHENSVMERPKFAGGQSAASARNNSNDDGLSDYEGLEKSTVIIGLCPDMCPESERGERERKGDLDRYERVDGDRNLTSKYLAVKKYNRTAEREASLIRPMPILQKTVGYLLDLLDQPYDESFLALYNFLWDRMRAIRMDLRMQHIFNQAAINMLEQMIRLHIIVMHELCEYTKGEGFYEGFDAHLNIEQMNKTSVELFQMYDDHRKKGINVPTEKEFRGYYALLKLDKHPGYKVEPAELSLELAKMTPEIRQTPEVVFARDVARACRTGNFIAFFRLARKASYLQACLMHAHFAKLRTQALASLHAGLLNNQGLPVAHVGRWLVMEEEDIESLLKYHGFAIKEFEEPYMVKEGPFLNSDKDYPTKCSKLVHMKRSDKIVEDVLASSQVNSLPTKATKAYQPRKHESKAIPSSKRKISVNPVDEEILDSEAYLTPKIRKPMQQTLKPLIFGQQGQDHSKVTSASISPWGFSTTHSTPITQHSSPKFQPAKMTAEQKLDNNIFDRTPEKEIGFGAGTMPMPTLTREPIQDRSPSSKLFGCSSKSLSPRRAATYGPEDEDILDTHHENETDEGMKEGSDKPVESEDELMANKIEEEVALAKLKLILRLWRRRCLRQKELREQRQLAANAALNSLSLGPPIQQNKDQLRTVGEFDIDHIMRERFEKLERSWSRVNVSDVISNILGRRNPDAKCLCWKIIVCSQTDDKMQGTHISHLTADRWLSSKIMPSGEDNDDDDLIVSSPGLSIWKKSSQSGADQTYCFSVVRESNFDNLNNTASGASAILFLVNESIPWGHQKAQLRKLLMSIPSGSCLPLLILSDSNNIGHSDHYSVIVNELGLNNIDRSRVNSFSVKSLIDNRQMMGPSDGFFSDEQLRDGLKWLASESPQQPVVYCLKTRDIILTHLSSNLEVLEKSSEHELGPNHCILAFNKALNRSLEEIVATAKSNPVEWPCHEIELVEDSNYEHIVAKSYLPSIGWSSSARIESFKRALWDLKLPIFADDIISWLSKGSNMGKEIENQRLQLENYLIRYLTEFSSMMGISLATKEASLMLKRSSRLELRDSSYYCIVPKWVMIFQRIFNWRLTSLTKGALSSAYISRQQVPSSGDLESSCYYLSQPPLDEIIEVGCSPIKTQMAESWSQIDQPLPQIASFCQFEETPDKDNFVADENNSLECNGGLGARDDICNIPCKSNDTPVGKSVSRFVVKEADKLSKLLECCNIVQTDNEKKLYVYF